MAIDAEFCKFVRRAMDESSAWNAAHDTWTDNMFRFVQICRFEPSLEDLEATEAAELVEEALAEVSEFEDPWEEFSLVEGQDGSWENFVALWDKIRVPAWFSDPLAEAVRLAEETPDDLIPLPNKPSRRAYRRLYAIAMHLQELVMQGDPIALPVERLGELLELSRQRVGKLREAAVKEGWLLQAAGYEAPSNGHQGVASTYWFRPLQRKPTK